VDLVIRAERAVIDGRLRPAAVAVADGVIRALGPVGTDYPATEQIRLAGAAVLMPGFVDTHVHINEPGTDWEGRRRRDIGPDTHDAVVISFAVPADLQRVEIDTSRFVFNASPEDAVLGSRALPCGEHGWALASFDVEVLPRTCIAPDARQVFVVDATNITALRVQAYPDGGLARVRAFGGPTEDGVVQLESIWQASC
jgi:allantoicase